ncbi:MAG TPA: FeoB-associated Cys-rich membrane protein [Clostridium sp.]|nr:FeoB-associated Cys-rich membrane protein [Clostridium sp.]
MGIINISTIIVLIIVTVCTVFAFKTAFVNKGSCGCGSCNGCSRQDKCKSDKKEN